MSRANELRALISKLNVPSGSPNDAELELLTRCAEDLERAENRRAAAVQEIRDRMAAVEKQRDDYKATAARVPELELENRIATEALEEVREQLRDRMAEPSDLEAFYSHLLKRLRLGSDRYGEKSFDRPDAELLGELATEALDLAGWGYVLWHRIQVLEERERVRAEELEPLWKLETKGAELLAAKAKDVLGRARDFVVEVVTDNPGDREDMTGPIVLEQIDALTTKLERSLLTRSGLGHPPAEPGARHASESDE